MFARFAVSTPAHHEVGSCYRSHLLSLQHLMKEYLAARVPERLALLVERVVTALRCTYPEEKETAYSLELRMSGRVEYAVRREVILDDLSKTVLYQLESIGSSLEPHRTIGKSRSASKRKPR